MAILKGNATFPGLTRILHCEMTWSQGITPSSANIEVDAQSNYVAAGGTLLLTYGGVSIPIPDCRVIRGSIRLNQQGQVVSIQVVDRRWKWAFGAINGRYNFVENAILGVGLGRPANANEQQSFRSFQLRTARQLADLCLIAMGETGYDISAITTDLLPEVNWDNTNPAQALADICDKCGCRVVLTLNNTVRIVRNGIGNALPVTPDMLDGSLSLTPPETPDSIKIVCGKTVFQDDLPLQAVGLDLDGRIRPIKELSYVPEAGLVNDWILEDPYGFGGISDDLTDGASAQELALKTVFRWYRVTNVLTTTDRETIVNRDGTPGPYKVPSIGKVAFIEQILPLDDIQLEYYLWDGQLVPKPAKVYGLFVDTLSNEDLDKLGNSQEGAEYPGEFSIDKARGIVMFSEPCYKYVDSGSDTIGPYVYPADICLRTSFCCNSYPQWSPIRYEYLVPIPGARWATGPKIVRADDIVFKVLQPYRYARLPDDNFVLAQQNARDMDRYRAATTDQPLPLITNLPEVAPEVQYLANTELLRFQTKPAAEASYAGLKRIDLDGAIQQVSWSIGPTGTTTRASRNSEFSAVVVPYHQRRLMEMGMAVTNRDLAERQVRLANLVADQAPTGR